MNIEWIGPLHLLGPDEHLLTVVLVAGGLASALLIALAIVAFARRRSWAYLLVTLALATLLLRVLLGFLTLRGAIGSASHHIVEHGLDVLAVALLLGAIYLARSVEPTGGPSP